MLRVSLRVSFNEQNIEHTQRLLRVTKKIFRQGYGHKRGQPIHNNTNNVRKTIGMIHRTTKKSELLMRKEPHLPMKEDISKGYMRKQSKSNWLSWSNRYGHRVVLRTAAPTQIV